MATAASATWANERRRATTTCRQPLDTVAITRSRSTVVKAVHGSYYSPRGLSSQLLEILILCRGIRARSLSHLDLSSRAYKQGRLHLVSSTSPISSPPSLRLQLATPSVAGPIRSSPTSCIFPPPTPPSAHLPPPPPAPRRSFPLFPPAPYTPQQRPSAARPRPQTPDLPHLPLCIHSSRHGNG